MTNITYKSNSSDFKAPLDMSYKCNKKQNVNFTSVDNPAWNNTLLNAVLTISKTQLEAFMNNTQSEFGSGKLYLNLINHFFSYMDKILCA